MRPGLICVLVLHAACIRSSSVECLGGTLCPEGTACVALSAFDQLEVCVRPDQAAPCDGVAEAAPCVYDGSPGFCLEGYCLPAACGNGRSEPGETCDDGNVIPGDGCSIDCRSNETCGNAIIDANGEDCDDGNAFSHDGCSSACEIEVPIWRELALELPPARVDHAIAYDVGRRTLVLFGGQTDTGSLPTTLGDTLEWNGLGWVARQVGFAPRPRFGHAMAYDPVRKRVVLFGGHAPLLPAALADTWEWDGRRWHLITPAVAPLPRAFHAMAYDPGRRRIVLFGGESMTQPTALRGDTWEWDGVAWTEIVQPESAATTTPQPRSGHSLAYDAHANHIVMFGGETVGKVLNAETFTLADGTWTKRAPAVTPLARAHAGMSFDGAGVVLAGGSIGAGATRQVHRWTGTSWAVQQDLGGARAHHAMAHDPHRTMIMVGSTGGTVAETEMQVWDGDSFVSTKLARLEGTSAAAFAHDRVRRRAWMFGGCGNAECSVATGLLLAFVDGVWTAPQPTLTAPAPSARGHAAMAYHERDGVAVMFGGTPSLDTVSAETWLLATADGLDVAWLEVDTGATIGPPARREAAMVYDAANERVVLFGGASAPIVGAVMNDLWFWQAGSWERVHLDDPARVPQQRSGHALGFDRKRGVVVMVGGDGATGRFADVWELGAGGAPVWTEVTPPAIEAAPAARSHATLSWNEARGRLVLVGGESADTAFDDVWEWDGARWTEVPATGPLPRGGHLTMPASDGTGIVIFGGSGTTGSQFADTWRLRWESATVDDGCRDETDSDGDAARGCADSDCWATCAPACEPSVTCAGDAPRCGDGICSLLESCLICPGDCACTPSCGDFECTADESASCPGDCL